MFRFTRYSLFVGIVILALVFPFSAGAAGNCPGHPPKPKWGYCGWQQPYYVVYPTFFVNSVVRNGTVTVTAYNLPASDTFQVRMGYYGTLGIHGIPVATFPTGSGGTQTMTFSIPPELYNCFQIAIRMQSVQGSGFYAYNWFYNNTAY